MSEALRACLAVALALGLVAAAGPAVQNARLAHSDAAARTAVAAVDRAVTGLAATTDPVPIGAGGATRVLRIDLPERSATAAGPVTVSIGGTGADGPGRDTVGYRVAGRPRHRLTVPVDVRRLRDGGVAPDGDALVLRSDAAIELRFALVGGRPTVLVRPLSAASPSASLGRTFK